MNNRIADVNKKVQPAPAPLPPCGSDEIGGCTTCLNDETCQHKPAPLPEEVGRMATWLDGLAKQHGKGVADNIDARSLGRAAMLLTTQARRLAEVEAERDEYRACAVKQDYARKDFICAMWTQVDRYEKDRANLNATCAALAVAAKRDRELTESAEAHISDLTRRLAEVEAGNGRFADMLESSVADWRKLYAEERAERVRIEGILLNDVQDERQESDEHIKGLVTVIKTQDKNIGDLKAHIQRIGVDHDDVEARAEAAESRVRELEAKKDAAFWQGWSLLAGFIAGFHDEPSLVEEAAREHGVTLGLLEASGCDEFELEPLRKRVFMSAALAATEVPNADA